MPSLTSKVNLPDVPARVQCIAVGLPMPDVSTGGFVVRGLTNAQREIIVRFPRAIARELVHGFAHLLCHPRPTAPLARSVATDSDVHAAWRRYCTEDVTLDELARSVGYTSGASLRDRFMRRFGRDLFTCVGRIHRAAPRASTADRVDYIRAHCAAALAAANSDSVASASRIA